MPIEKRLLNVPKKVLSEESGFVLILMAVLLAVLVSFAAYVVNVGYASIVREQLKGAATLAAYSAAAVLCTTRECYSDSQIIAREILRSHKIDGPLGKETVIPSINSFVNGRAVFQSRGVRDWEVVVERGNWMPNRSPRFVPEQDWSQRFANLSRVTLSNSVHVRVRRSNVNFITAPLVAQNFELVGEATALIGEMEEIPMPPLALHLCSLVRSGIDSDEYEEVRPEWVHGSDRIFSSTANIQQYNILYYNSVGDWGNVGSFYDQQAPPAGRHCGTYETNYGNPNLQNSCNTPTFSWTPNYFHDYTAPPPAGDPSFKLIPGEQGSNSPGNECLWRRSFIHWDASSYGILGLGGNILAPSEADIRAALGEMASWGSAPCSRLRTCAGIGDQFNVLIEELDDSASHMMFWNAITNRGRVDETHPSYRKVFGTQIKVNWKEADWCYEGYGTSPPLGDVAFEYGHCNSQRIYWGGQAGIPPSACLVGFATPPGSITNNLDTPVWEVNVPVVTQLSGPPCTGNYIDNEGYRWISFFSPSGAGPGNWLDFFADWEYIAPGAQDYMIVGTVRVHLFDVDIGQAPPLSPADSCVAPGIDPFLPPPSGGGSFEGSWATSRNTVPKPWSALAPCNLVRGVARYNPRGALACSNAASETRRPLLIAEPVT